MQTIPSLALLASSSRWSGRIGAVPAFIALFLYALLPIVRNTHAGAPQIPSGMKQAALSLGMREVVLPKIELPLAAPTILAGIKTSAVINVGTATIAAFIGAGGFGERIVAGPRAERQRDAARRSHPERGARAAHRGRVSSRRARALAGRSAAILAILDAKADDTVAVHPTSWHCAT